jgi:lipopolysaccharide export system protein LptA
LQNQEAARYARWAAATAVAIALIVAAVYGRREFNQLRAEKKAPPPVPAHVQQQSNEFAFSKEEQGRTIFRVRAAHATQYKEQNRALLEDVWITIYGRNGDRNDNIHTRQCSYDPKSGGIQCEGDVEIDVQGSNPSSGKPADSSLVVKTHNLFFNRETGEASTPEPVEFRFPQGQGHGTGVTYSTRDAIVRLNKDVDVTFSANDRTGGLPIEAHGASLEISRNNRLVVLPGAATVRQGSRELAAEKISIDLDEDFRARRAVAEGHPEIRSAAESGGRLDITAAQFEAELNPTGWVQRIVADGGVSGSRESAAGTDHFSAARVELAMLPEHNLINEMTAAGSVAMDSHQGGDSRSIKTESLRAKFGPGAQPDQQRIVSAETLAPGTIETKAGGESTILRAKKFVTEFTAEGRLGKLDGHSGVEIRRQLGNGAPQISTSNELVATFAKSGEWDTLDQTGNVRFQQADRRATAAHARIVRSTDMLILDGSPILSDSQSRTTASSIAINQKSGAIEAKGPVASTYLSGKPGASEVNIGSGPAHVTADSLSGSTTSGDVTYAGHARLWQGESVLDSDRIEIWRDDKKMQATGNVVAVFPQASGPAPVASSAKPVMKPVSRSSGPTLWKIHAPVLTYWNDQGKAHMEGGVTTESNEGSLQSPTLDVFFNEQGSARSGDEASSPGQGSGQLRRALALGGVTVRQADRLGKSAQAEYTASEGKFVLSGGNPTLTDASGDTTAGRSLTFFVASDTILVDSQEGLRTLTKHRVEK